jgi:hypothetical protein
MTRSNSRIRIQTPFVVALCAAALGCASDPVNIGDGQQKVDKSELASYAATWDGYVEAHTFQSGSDRVRVTLDEAGEGWLQVGEGDPLPLPTDPNVAWPPTADGSGGWLGSTLQESVRYTLADVRIESERIRFAIATLSAFAPFCELQTPMEQEGTPVEYGCTADNTYVTLSDDTCQALLVPGGEWENVDCDWVQICIEACSCNASSCTIRSGHDVPLDAALDDTGDELVGTIILPNDGVGPRTIRLQRE